MTGRRVPLTDELIRHDVDVSWWVTSEAYELGFYRKVYDALTRWVEADFPFEDPYYSNAEVPGPEGAS